MLFATGAGAQASSWLLSRPGASATVLETRAPYSRRASRELLDLALPAHTRADPRAARAAADADAASLSYASREMAVRLARAAHVRAMQLAVHLPGPSGGGGGGPANRGRDLTALMETCCYLREFLAKPHPLVGRRGPVVCVCRAYIA